MQAMGSSENCSSEPLVTGTLFSSIDKIEGSDILVFPDWNFFAAIFLTGEYVKPFGHLCVVMPEVRLLNRGLSDSISHGE